MDEKKRVRHSIFAPLIFLYLLWIVKLAEQVLNIDLRFYGIIPRHIVGLPGIVTAPLIHSNYTHLLSNSVPIFLLGMALVYFYKELAMKVSILIFLGSGMLVWIIGRTSSHIGASGLVYGVASFLFFSGAIRRDQRLLTISLLVTFVYGGLVWGIFPIQPDVSWESHLSGAVTGAVCAFLFRKEGPQRKEYDWGDEEDDDLNPEEIQPEEGDTPPEKPVIRYIYKEDKSGGPEA